MTRDRHGFGKTGYNPRIHNPPWQNRATEPACICSHCGKAYERPDQRTEEVDLTTLRTVRRCPHCDSVVSEHTADVTEGYLKAWREEPAAMVETIDQYTDLKRI